MSIRIDLVVRHAVIVTCIVLMAAMSAGPSATVAAQKPTLTSLRDVDELKTLFNRDRGKVRLVLLLSPT